MPAVTNHPAFIQPSQNVKLWRYMDFTKFVSLISSNELFFCRADKFDDPYEGTLPQALHDGRIVLFRDHPEETRKKLNEQVMKDRENYRESTYINCWHANNYESAAMWDLYSKTSESIAIETNYSTLKEILPDNAFLGMVNYIDYLRDSFDPTNMILPFAHKRKSFEHENEIRALITYFGKGSAAETDHIKLLGDSGLSAQIDTGKLIKKIYTNPKCATWFTELVSTIARTYNIQAEVINSNLYTAPIY